MKGTKFPVKFDDYFYRSFVANKFERKITMSNQKGKSL